VKSEDEDLYLLLILHLFKVYKFFGASYFLSQQEQIKAKTN